jgi:hypothetical protein
MYLSALGRFSFPLAFFFTSSAKSYHLQVTSLFVFVFVSLYFGNFFCLLLFEVVILFIN